MKTREFKQAEYFYPNDQNKNMIYIKNTVKAPNVHIGEFTFYDTHGTIGAEFEQDNILYNVPGHGDLYIGKFCSIAYGVEIIMGAANHSIHSFSSYPFNLISKNWASRLGMTKKDLPDKGDTIIGNDVWIGRKTRIMPGVKIGDGAIIGSYSVVTKDVPPYTIAAGDPIKAIRPRFAPETIEFLEHIKWWDFTPQQLERAIPYLSSVDLEQSRKALEKIAE
ncbi:MAG: CatB-related O-acetyltransferase [Oscillospiraceae bacterium]|jgi:virginiamycin A acetyltransferase